ncbi:hypothetical protein [Hyphomonas pacifica]|uniref:hypothetical protein n=1 Tax=Hyphomonas pacifica TaxID=1280941 RepID=UPI000DBFA8F6|nr:hypothetical protein [Hyphomonas pacifica]RAN31792.1 hypothetical protein HY11_06275 [Hyphomonas pacifica]
MASENEQLVFCSLGEFIYQFATLENYIRFAIIQAIDAEDESAAMFLINKMDAKVCLAKLRAILKQRHTYSEELQHLVTSCEEASNFRNEILHLAPAIFDGTTELRVFPFGANIQRGQSGTSPKIIPAQQLELAARFCVDAYIDFACFRRTLKRGETLSIAGLTKAAFPAGFPKYQTADQAIAHSFDREEYEAAHARADLLSEDAPD